MTQEDKNLLLKDLCARLPYEVKVYSDGIPHEQILIGFIPDIEHYNIKPYLRPMSSMTEEEIDELKELTGTDEVTRYGFSYQGLIGECFGMMYDDCSEIVDWLTKKMFDYRGLIPMGLALPALEGMYS